MTELHPLPDYISLQKDFIEMRQELRHTTKNLLKIVSVLKEIDVHLKFAIRDISAELHNPHLKLSLDPSGADVTTDLSALVDGCSNKWIDFLDNIYCDFDEAAEIGGTTLALFGNILRCCKEKAREEIEA
jgi:hypothetical protein